MKLNWKMNQETNCLTIELEGRIDSTNVAEAEAAIFELHNQNEGANIVFDAQKLEYISSAGLRVLLKVRKMQDELLIQNVSVDRCQSRLKQEGMSCHQIADRISGFGRTVVFITVYNGSQIVHIGLLGWVFQSNLDRFCEFVVEHNAIKRCLK